MSRKSIERVDAESPIKKKKNRLETLMGDMSLENFKDSLIINRVTRKSELLIDLSKAGTAHLPKKSERFSYEPISEYGIIYIPVNRLKQVYQTDKALNKYTVKIKAGKMRKGKKMPPIYVGYAYDVHDGHHSLAAAIKLGYTHVPCKIVGDDVEKLNAAKKRYREVWKSEIGMDLVKAIEAELVDIVQSNMDDEEKAIERYDYLIEKLHKYGSDAVDLVKEIMTDEKNHYTNLSQLLEFLNGDKDAIKENKLEKAGFLVIDLFKGELHKGRLVKRRIPVKGKNGSTFYRMQWVDPHANIPGMQHPGKQEMSYGHHEEGIKDMERAQSNRFPVRQIPVKDLTNTHHNYSSDKAKVDEAIRKYHDGEKLPVVKISPTGQILDNPYLVDMAKKLGLTHVPVVVVGSTVLKKQLEDKLKDEVIHAETDQHGNEVRHVIKPSYDVSKPNTGNEKKDAQLSQDIISSIEHFKNITTKRYTKDYIMKQAKSNGIGWKEHTNAGEELPANSNILWMNAHMAIMNHIKEGKPFSMDQSTQEQSKKLEQSGKGAVYQGLLQISEKFNGDKNKIKGWARANGINWRSMSDPQIDYMECIKAIKKQLALGENLDGVQVDDANAKAEAQLVISDHIREHVSDLGKRHGKGTIMDRADTLGIPFDKTLKKTGERLPENSNILWMNAHRAISKYMAAGNEFAMAGDVTPEQMGVKAKVGQYGEIKPSINEKIALDHATRNSQKMESKIKDWAIQSLQIDRGIDSAQAQEIYDKFRESARNARLLIPIDMNEKLTSGVNLLDQITADGHIKNDFALNRGFDTEHKEVVLINAFGDDYRKFEHEEAPIFGNLDLFNQGLGSNPDGGSVAFVLKSDVKSRSTGSHIASDQIEFGDDGKWSRSLNDPHHLVADRWMSRWAKPKNKDAQRIRAMDSVISGKTHGDDKNYFESHIHGGVDIKRDVDHILVPHSWQMDKTKSEHHNRIKQAANLFGVPMKYDAPDGGSISSGDISHVIHDPTTTQSNSSTPPSTKKSNGGKSTTSSSMSHEISIESKPTKATTKTKEIEGTATTKPTGTKKKDVTATTGEPPTKAASKKKAIAPSNEIDDIFSDIKKEAPAPAVPDKEKDPIVYKQYAIDEYDRQKKEAYKKYLDSQKK